MSGGVVFDEAFTAQVVRVVRHVLRNERNARQTGNRHGKHGITAQACILDGDLAAATDAKTSPGSATATFCTWNAGTGAYVEGSFTETVYNHSEVTSYLTDTFGFAFRIDGLWRFFGDCDAMGSR